MRATEWQTKTGFAHLIRYLLDVRYAYARTVQLIMDNLGTNSVASLYKAFEPAAAEQMEDKLAIHHTPRHGSWQNIGERKLSILGRQSSDRRIPDQVALAADVSAWGLDRYGSGCDANSQFRAANARIKLKRLYPAQVRRATRKQC